MHFTTHFQSDNPSENQYDLYIYKFSEKRNSKHIQIYVHSISTRENPHNDNKKNITILVKLLAFSRHPSRKTFRDRDRFSKNRRRFFLQKTKRARNEMQVAISAN